jgi:hypothetical protein
MLVHPEESTMSQLLSRSGNMPTHFPEKTLNLRPGSGSLNFCGVSAILGCCMCGIVVSWN